MHGGAINHIRIARLAPAPGGVVPGWLLDKMAEEKLTGGFDTRKANRCPSCFTARSANGSCLCD